jgi:DNA-binding LacI/PurR family transcriptional regulator
MKQHRVSLKDLATELGVSIATVSRALHGSHEVGEDMRRRVIELAKERHYRPNPFAQSLRKDAPHIIGVIVPDLVTHYYASVMVGIEDFASKNGYSVFSANSHEDCHREERAIDNFVAMHVDGIIACLAQDTTDYSHYEQLYDMDIPVVLFARTCLTDKFSQVVANGAEAAYDATTHLIATGSRRIAFIGGPNHLNMVVRRKHGYLQALKDARLPIDRTIVACGKIDFEWARSVVLEMLQRPDRPDAILAFNDIITYAVLDAVKSLKLRIPDDVAIIGFTDNHQTAYASPALSVIMDQAQEQGALACDLLIRRIKGDRRIYKEVVPMKMVIRDSSDKVKKVE